MATVDKAFRVKNGLAVETRPATIASANILAEDSQSNEYIQDLAGAMFTNGTYTGITFTYDDINGVVNAAVSATPTFSDRIIFEGLTPDDYETTLLVTEPTQDVTVTLPNQTTTLVGKDTTDTFTNKTFNTAATGNTLQISGNTISSYVGSGSNVVLSSSPTISTLYVSNGLNVTGATTGSTQIVAANTASGVLTLPSATGTIALTSDIPSLSGYVTETGTQTLTNKTLTSPIINGVGLIFEGATDDSYEINVVAADPTSDTTLTLPNVTGTFITTGDTGSVTSGVLASDSVTNSKLANDAVDTAEIKDGAVTNAKLAGSITNDKLSNSAITINGVSTSLGSSRTLGTDDVAEGSTNKYFTDERAQDAVAAAIAAGTQTNITITYDDNAGSLSFNASGGVSSLSGTANEIEVSASTGAVTVGLPNDITIAGNITINGTPTNSNHAVTKGYVDAFAEGLHVHASCVTATTANVNLSTDLEAGDIIDAVTLVAGDRVLVKNQSTTSENGIYIASTSGAAVRASDFNSSAEIQGGDFVFVTGAALSYNKNTGWVQVDKVTTVGTDPIEFIQFSGAGTYTAGNGLTLQNGTQFVINTAITADLNSAQTFTNKTLTSPTVSGLYLSDNNIVIEGTNDTHETTLTFTDPTSDRTITFKDESGTVAYTADIESAIDGFGNAVTGSTGISVAYASTSNTLTITNTDTGSAQNIFKNIAVGATTISADSNNDTLTLSAGTGISLQGSATSDTVTITNDGVTSLFGTANQVIATGSTGAITLSLPQSIAATSSPTFASLSVGSGSVTAGSVTLADALIGTATTSISGTSATIVDTWSASSYRSAKYIVQMINGDDIEVLEVLVTVDGNNNVYLTEYADVQSNTQLGTTNADYSGGDVRLLVTSTNGTSVKVHKTLIEV